MNRQTITFSANEQGLQKTGGITHYASDTISYIDAIFSLGENWNGFDEVRAIFKTPYTCNFAVLNSEGECTVPLEALVNKGSVRVNLVGSIYTEEAVVDRLTTHSVEALIIDEDVPVCGSESAPLEPSEYEQFVAKVANDANRAEAGASDAETSAQNAKTSEDNAKASEDNAKASETHAQTYAQNAHNSAISAENAKDEAEDARDEIRSMTATATTLAEGSQATASYSNGVLSLGIPRGDKGNKGDTGASAGFGTVTASVDDTIGTPSVEVTTSGSDTAKNFAFAFHNLKGQKGDKGDTGEVTMEMLEDLLPTDTASGAIASFPDGTDILPAISVLDSIEPIQDLNGYDKPWSGGNGKNKANIDDSENGGIDSNGNNVVDANNWRSISLIPIQSGQAYTLHAVGMAITRLYFYDTDGNFISPRVVSQTDTVTATAPSNAKYAKWTIYKTGITLADVQSANVQLEEGTTATIYEPYSNICPISGRTEVVTSRCGVNVWDEEWENGYLSNTTGEPVASNAQIRSKNFIPILESETYYCKASASVYAYFYDANKDFVGYMATNVTNKTFVPLANARYLKFYLTATTYNNDISINYPSTDHDYHAYNGTSYTTALGQTVYGGTLDVVSGVLTVDRACVTFDGSESWDVHGVIASWFYIDNVLPNAYINNDEHDFAIASEYTQYNYSVGGSIPSGVFIVGSPASGTIRLALKNTNFTTVAQFKAHLAQTNLNICYELATPQTYQLTPQEVDLILGTNNLWCDSGNIEVNYYADIQKWVEKKIN